MVPIVLVRGLLREAGHWHFLVGALKELEPDLRIYTPNVPGNGDLYKETSPVQIEQMLYAVIEQLPSDIGRYHIIAISMGSMLGSCWAHQVPQNVASLTLINPSFARFSPINERFNLKEIPRLLISKLHGSQAFERTILNLTYPNHVLNPSILSYHLALNEKHPVKFSNALRQLFAAARFAGPEKSPSCPTQVITSSDDKLVNSLAGKRIAEAWQVAHIPFDSDAHDLPADSPTELAQYLLHWLKKVEA